jgi:protein-L-isoaspartate O-methyltransferase
VGAGTEGLPEHAPYDTILISAVFPRIPPPLVEQLAFGGQLIQPIGAGGEEKVVLFEKRSQGLRRRRTIRRGPFCQALRRARVSGMRVPLCARRIRQASGKVCQRRFAPGRSFFAADR